MGKQVGWLGRIITMQRLVIALYSDDSSVRQAVSAALGKQLDHDLPPHEVKEFATADALRLYVDGKKQVDLFILDEDDDDIVFVVVDADVTVEFVD